MVVSGNLNFGGDQVPLEGLAPIIEAKIKQLSIQEQAKLDALKEDLARKMQDLAIRKRDQELRELKFENELQQRDLDNLYRGKMISLEETKPQRQAEAARLKAEALLPIEAAKQELAQSLGFETFKKQQKVRLLNAKELARQDFEYKKQLAAIRDRAKTPVNIGEKETYLNSLNEIDSLNKLALKRADDITKRLGAAVSKRGKKWLFFGGKSPKQIAETVGVSRDIVSKYMNAVKDPNKMEEFRNLLLDRIKLAGGRNSISALIQHHQDIVNKFTEPQQDIPQTAANVVEPKMDLVSTY